MSTVIQISNLSKIYRLGEIGTGTISRDLERWYKMKIKGQEDPFMKIGETNDHSKKGQSDMVYSLRNINLDVKQGEAIGIIGKNGAGKSTLLKIISRVTSPTSGKIRIKGRIASLLEVGTGFHPELTGRENIYLNGAILGMRKKEITRKLDEIVDFSGVERYIDTPVKRYSSGMYVRLAFAVAAHLESEILIVDEVLAVGDIAFQKKCLGKMGEMSKGEGRTVLFVSHNMGAIQQLCSQAILLKEGSVILNDSVRTVISNYFTSDLMQSGEQIWPNIDQAPGNEVARLHAVRVLDRFNNVCTDFDVCDPVLIEMEYWVLRDVAWLDASFYLSDDSGRLILSTFDDTTDTPEGERRRVAGFHKSVCHIPPDFLNDGQFYVQAALTDEKTVHTIQRNIVMFNVRDAMDVKGVRGNYRDPWPLAAVRPRLKWTTEHSQIETE